ncbi:MAG TPA: rhomboid family intramembrane serine protease [bacterium]
MIPLKDENPTRSTPWLTLLLLALNVYTYGWEVAQSGNLLQPMAAAHMRALADVFGVVPARLWNLEGGWPGWPVAGSLFPLVTSTFLHGDLMHLFGNMLYLWIFGNNVEDVMGHARFVLFYFVCAVVAAVAQTLADPRSAVPMIGASGAIAGVLGAYLVRFPRANVLVLVWFFLFLRVVRIPALIMLGLWFVYQLLAAGRGGGGIAWHAHIGGFVAGALLLHVFVSPSRRRR